MSPLSLNRQSKPAAGDSRTVRVMRNSEIVKSEGRNAIMS